MTTVLITLLAVVLLLVVVLVVEIRVPVIGDERHADLVPVDPTDPTVIVFLTTTCTTCAELWSSAGATGSALRGGARLLLVTRGADAEDQARVRRLAPPGVRVVMSTAAWRRFGVTVAPFAVCMDAAGKRLAEGPVSSWSDVVQMCPTRVDIS